MELGKYIGSKIKHYRTLKKMTQDQLAKKLGLGKGTISNYESGYRTPQQNRLFELAEALDISINDLFPPTEEKANDINLIYNQLEPPRQKKVYNFAERQLKEQEQSDVTVYGLSAAGEAIEYNDQFEIQEEKVSYIPKGTDGALIVKGNSMSPTLEDGELLFFEQTPQVENGEIAVVEIKGEAVTTKRVRYDFEDEEIVLQSINPDYDDMRFKNEDVRIIGRVLL